MKTTVQISPIVHTLLAFEGIDALRGISTALPDCSERALSALVPHAAAHLAAAIGAELTEAPTGDDTDSTADTLTFSIAAPRAQLRMAIVWRLAAMLLPSSAMANANADIHEYYLCERLASRCPGHRGSAYF